MLYEARLFIDGGAPMYEPPHDVFYVTKEIREEMQIPKGNGTAGHFGWIDKWAEVLGVLKLERDILCNKQEPK